ncbi:MAG: cytochrome-c oxidase, cbb3-type subunit III [Mesorhizobium sp.]|uniref:cytochrome-c oxidase, cbb3-type subunit III n=1 Tax=unclassified Mesorhizobium TaxID=325217 RepID=UPI000FCA1F3F|nr:MULTISPECIES: cytochrome-c oxidase, cbb3-type subunit III [unclassified Mesorhizobium]RUV73240.1 cytochrome-c oxidase, cbb3-type subunit III [Mesorhizobium sp. M5C.F.Cr.IN.023.01.1.1]RWF86663.1 MAG: cytochrome-c oxidase, cbb3-type subunit III [Mesorhizobium sp.]RWF95376.1 MAG: cytochrome-c oxidase, cbb3-type subunit III [Mesorhizobium sp.]RWI39786.1 MAG: cytochrome-c oxidase, cbb3-type subunit III [Mesorhizobium sp.]RWI45348.1 MAG: cytochrome-c oxidase, cbb3-type subunit III [Mesorhizobium 
MSEKQIDEISGVSTTGHEWDGIRELDNPMPRWWVWTFYATIVWAIAYAVAYPAWPLLSSATTGLLGYSSRTEVKDELKAVETAKADYIAAISAKSVEEIIADENLRTFATAAGAAAYKVNCVQCHGSGAEGSEGFPNLNDDDWLWGGDIATIQQTIAHGVRFSADSDTRVSEMPAFKDILEPQQIASVASFAASLSGIETDPMQAEAGKTVFAENCASCHGDAGKGNKELGAPDLTDAIALYVSTESTFAAQIRSPKHGVMPAWQGRLGDINVKELATYVHSLGGGE